MCTLTSTSPAGPCLKAEWVESAQRRTKNPYRPALVLGSQDDVALDEDSRLYGNIRKGAVMLCRVFCGRGDEELGGAVRVGEGNEGESV